MGHLDRLLLGEKLVGKEQEFYWLWILATTLYGVGDLVTTITILEFDVGIRESNLLLQQIFDSLGQTGVVGLKLAVFFVCITVSMIAVEYWDERPMYYAPPILLIGLGLIVTTNNMYLFLF